MHRESVVLALDGEVVGGLSSRTGKLHNGTGNFLTFNGNARGVDSLSVEIVDASRGSKDERVNVMGVIVKVIPLNRILEQIGNPPTVFLLLHIYYY